MLSVVIAAEEAEWPVVSTLVALVPAAAKGVVRDVILVDRHGNDAFQKVADVAGCHLEVLKGTRGAALAGGAARARGPWLMVLAPGAVPEPGWADDVARFLEAAQDDGNLRAATFTAVADPNRPRTLASLLGAFGQRLRAEGNGLVIQKAFYDALGGYRSGDANPERNLLSRIGRGSRARLRARLVMPPRERPAA